MKYVIMALLLIGCAKHEAEFISGMDGRDGYNSISYSEVINPGPICSAGGVETFIGLDLDRNGVFDSNDFNQTNFIICNGTNGINGISPTINSESSGLNCPNGGVSVLLGTDKTYICNGINGNVGPQGPAGIDAEVIKITSVNVTASCGYVNGVGTEGVWVRFWVDRDNDTWIGPGEVLSSYTVCNGKNVALSDATSAQCPNGGVKLDVPGSTKYICNGLKGETGSVGSLGPKGEDGKSAYEIALDNGFVGTELEWLTSLHGNTGLTGPQGPIGPQGPAGTAGVGNTSAIQLCPGDSATYPEYGLVIGNSVYAVYYGVVNGSIQAFLAKLSPGSYATTNGPTCNFTVSNCNSGNTCINGNQVTNVNQSTTGNLVVNMGNPSNSTHSYSVGFTVTNNYDFTTGSFKIEFDIPSNVNTITCSGAVNNPTLVRTGNTVTLTPNGYHTFWNINPNATSGVVTCQIDRPWVSGGYSDNAITNYSATIQ